MTEGHQNVQADQSFAALQQQISDCRLCAQRFSQTASRHSPKPVVWFAPQAQILIAGQAPGTKVHQSGRPFTDASGARLRDWLGLQPDVFYDRSRLAIVPMAFCFPGQDAMGADLPPPPLCARTWRHQVIASLPRLKMILLVGGYALRWHLGDGNVTKAVANWRSYAAKGLWPLPHPSWRNTGWITKNPWFATELLPALRADLHRLLETPE